MHGVFPSDRGNPHLHGEFNFTEVGVGDSGGNRYAIRAGRNLPDKEFRYLRTVIVTAAVYWGFNSVLALLLLTFRHRAGVRPYTSSCDFAEPCVFDKQSLPLMPPVWLLAGTPFFRSYGGNLPSSFNTSSLKRLGILYRPPVSVSGTVI